MSRGGSSGGGRSSLSYLFEPEETVLYRTRTSNQETEKAPDTNSGCVKQDDDEKKTVGTEAVHSPPKREVSNPILSSHKPPCNIYHTGQLSSGLLITDRPSTRVRCAPGGASSLGFLFGEEHEK
ncbi:nitrilase-associated protein [Zea mays]|uniref:Nitrilase-associated protein n=1 Tax=Zea mays TaxID=4577 RepID=B6T6L3_MAIZE|nr:nitrilase-associated protein [Zea mays]ACG32746.1 nitrilase-associated protein [Zea mays]ONM14717.1 Nitrilase-associated protein [Zea mays]|eukprot:NP_001148748.1 nitrilase-associated protein [Zea mays]